MVQGRVVTGLVISIAAIGVGAYVGYRIASDPIMRDRIMRSFKSAFETSKQRVADMSEDVAVRTAQVTNNPKINQDWVAHQWESVGY